MEKIINALARELNIKAKQAEAELVTPVED